MTNCVINSQMTNSLRMAIAFFFVICLFGSGFTTSDGYGSDESPPPFAREIDEVNRLHERLYMERKWDELQDLWTGNCVVLPPGAPAFGGDPAVGGDGTECIGYAAAMEWSLNTLGWYELLFETVELVGPLGGGGALYGFEHANWEALDANGDRVDFGKYITIWKKVNGIWKYHRDIFNSDQPPPS